MIIANGVNQINLAYTHRAAFVIRNNDSDQTKLMVATLWRKHSSFFAVTLLLLLTVSLLSPLDLCFTGRRS